VGAILRNGFVVDKILKGTKPAPPLFSIASLPSATSRHPDRSSMIPLHRPRVYCDKSIYIDKFRNCAYLNDSDRNVIRTDRDVRKPTEKDQVNTQVSA